MHPLLIILILIFGYILIQYLFKLLIYYSYKRRKIKKEKLRKQAELLASKQAKKAELSAYYTERSKEIDIVDQDIEELKQFTLQHRNNFPFTITPLNCYPIAVALVENFKYKSNKSYSSWYKHQHIESRTLNMSKIIELILLEGQTAMHYDLYHSACLGCGEPMPNYTLYARCYSCYDNRYENILDYSPSPLEIEKYEEKYNTIKLKIIKYIINNI